MMALKGQYARGIVRNIESQSLRRGERLLPAAEPLLYWGAVADRETKRSREGRLKIREGFCGESEG